MANPTLAKYYTRLLALWPKDALRPNLSFTRTLEYRGSSFGLKPTTGSDIDKSNVKAATLYKPQDSRSELANVNALFLLLENKFSKKYPLAPDVLKPKSNPGHYTRLMKEIERAPGKSWWAALVDEWKMKIRWK